MNWGNFAVIAMRALLALPAAINLVEQLHHGKPGASKKDKVLEIVGLGNAVADTVDPAHAATFDAVVQHVGTVIDSSVAIANAVGHFNSPQTLSPPVIIVDPDPVTTTPGKVAIPAKTWTPPAVVPDPASVPDSTGTTVPLSGPGAHNTVPA